MFPRWRPKSLQADAERTGANLMQHFPKMLEPQFCFSIIVQQLRAAHFSKTRNTWSCSSLEYSKMSKVYWNPRRKTGWVRFPRVTGGLLGSTCLNMFEIFKIIIIGSPVAKRLPKTHLPFLALIPYSFCPYLPKHAVFSTGCMLLVFCIFVRL